MKKTLIIAALLLVAVAASAQDTATRWQIGLATGWNGVGYHHFRHTTFADGVGQVFVPVYVGTEWRFAPRWHLALELAYNDASTLRLGIRRRF